jgi:hypothetical protein
MLALCRFGLLLTPLVAQYLIHVSLPLALMVYCSLCLLCVVCLRLLPIETVGRQVSGARRPGEISLARSLIAQTAA